MRGIFSHPYVKFVAKKAIFYLLVAFVALNLIFLIPRIGPGDPVSRMIPQGARLPPEEFQKIYEYYKRLFGLDKQLFPDQFLHFWKQTLTFDFGHRIGQYWTQQVKDVVLFAIPYTFALVIPVLVLSFSLGNWIGAKAAYAGGKLSEIVYFFSVFANRVPFFWLFMILVFLLARQAKLFPAIFVEVSLPFNFNTFPRWLQFWFLPFLSLFIVYLGGWATGMRAMVIHEMDSGYVRYGEQLGFREGKLMSYAKRNAMLPQFTGINLYLNALIGETAIIEILYGWPGIGNVMYSAISNYDYPLISGCFIILMIIVIFGNFLVDVLYGLVDPRIRIGGRW